jgi:hypothetical protein
MQERINQQSLGWPDLGRERSHRGDLARPQVPRASECGGVFGFDEQALADWCARVGRHGQARHESPINSADQNVFFYKLVLDRGSIAPKR